MPANFNDLRLNSDVRLEPHPIEQKDVPNFTVENVVAPRRVYDAKKTRVLVTVAGYNTQKAEKNVSLVLNGRDRGNQAGADSGKRARQRGIQFAGSALRPQ